MRSSAPRVSVIVLSYNTRELLARCLRSLEGNVADGLAEVIVWDNASSDGSVELVEREFPWVTLIASDRNLGFSTANNRAARDASGQFILALNADAALRPGALERSLAVMEDGPDIGVVGLRLVDSDGSYQQSARRFPCPLGLFLEATGLDALTRWTRYGSFAGDTTRTVDYVSGAAMLVRRDVWDDLGGFDEGFFFYGEDADLCARARALRREALFVHDAEVVHQGGASAAALSYAAALEGYRSAFRFILKHQGRWALWVARAWVVLGAAVRVVVAVLAALVARGVARSTWLQRLRAYCAVLRQALSGDPLPRGGFADGP
jgi:hypothetical protein